MPYGRLEDLLATKVQSLTDAGTRKSLEAVVSGIVPPSDGKGPRYLLEGQGDKPFLRMNANNYLGMSFEAKVIAAEEEAVGRLGTGPGAVRFISGTWAPHVALEARLAAFHGREAAMIFSSAYATVMGVLSSLITNETAVISDELNHNCIINAMRVTRPIEKRIYKHLDLAELEQHLQELSGHCKRAILVTDGIFSMRGDHAPLKEISALVEKYDSAFPENLLLVVDDSHGVGAFGETGRGTEEYTGAGKVDLLIATLGKALGVNGGYIVASQTIVDYLRETSPFYIYSNPITQGEAAAAKAAVDILDSDYGRERLRHLRAMTTRFEQGLTDMGLETIPGAHPVVPLMVRDTERTTALVAHLRANGILATGLNFPVVPRGDEEIRFQIAADHTEADIDEALQVIGLFNRH